MTYDREALRAITLGDNLEWLRSFGCTVHEYKDLILIDHPWLPEYRACLITRATSTAVRQVTDIVDGDAAGPPTVYVDRDAATADVWAALRHARAVSCNVTVAGRVAARAWRSSTRLVPAAANEWQHWSTLYSRGFGRENRSTLDAARWQVAFMSAHVRHWFFLHGGTRVGVCQTTNAAVQGIYSFTIVPEARSMRATLNGVRALLGYISARPSPWIYFEVLNQSPLSRNRVQSAMRLTNVRTLDGYRLPNAREV